VIFRCLVVGALVLTSCGSLNGETQSGALAGSRATAAPSETAGSPVGAPAAGNVRVKDDFGGWSIDRPATWFDMPQAFHGSSLRNIDFGMNDFPPPPGSVGLSLRLEAVHPGEEGLDLETFGKRRVWISTCAVCLKLLERDDVAIGGEPAKFFSVYQNQPSPLEQFEPHLYWLVRSPFFADRVLVIAGGPTTSPAREELERIVGTIPVLPARAADPGAHPYEGRGHRVARRPGAHDDPKRGQAHALPRVRTRV
jgi:hypothetical protein